MKKIFTLLVSSVFMFSVNAQLPIISQYYEGSSYNKWIEVNNPTSSIIDISGYYVCNFNSSTDTTDIPTACVQLNGTLAPNNSFLVMHPSAVLPTYPTANAVGGCSFNGNDKVVITTSNSGSSAYADRIDEIGGPVGGANWGIDKSFYRNPGINTPSTTYSASDWTQKTISEVDNAAVNTFEYLGWHNVDQLPIELLDFSVKKAGNNTLVEWSTLSEENSDYFAVEWSVDGVIFEEIAKIEGAGSSREKTEYSYRHANPVSGVNYYRLTQYDLDGRSESFDVQQVVFASDKKEMFITPTRVENNIRVGFSSAVEKGVINIFDMQGKMIEMIDIADGVNSVNIDVSALSTGQYVVRYIDKLGTISKRFVKL